MDFLFALVLFVLYFCIGCWLSAKPTTTTATTATCNYYSQVVALFEEIALSEAIAQQQQPIPEPTPHNTLPLLAPLPIPDPKPMTLPPIPIPDPTPTPKLDIDHIKLVDARKLAKALGIRQKVNGKNQPLAWLRAQIKASLASAEPDMLSELEEILAA